MSGSLAWCHRCKLPLVFTFLVPRMEWFCVGCQRSWPWFGEPTIGATPEREDLAARLKERFSEVARPIIVAHSKVDGCDRCANDGTDHDEHATDDERAASEQAWKALRDPATWAANA